MIAPPAAPIGYAIPAWHGDAPCAQVGPELFDPAIQSTLIVAEQVCSTCPFARGGLLSLCVQDGFDVDDHHLVRAGRSMATWRREAKRELAS